MSSSGEAKANLSKSDKSKVERVITSIVVLESQDPVVSNPEQNGAVCPVILQLAGYLKKRIILRNPARRRIRRPGKILRAYLWHPDFADCVNSCLEGSSSLLIR